MATVRELVNRKGSHVLTIGQEATVLDAAIVMNEHKIGALVVTDAGRVVGMFSERDVLRRVVVEQREPASTRVAEVMTPDVVCCTMVTSIDEARTAMKDRRIRHLPVVNDDQQLEGLISIGDLNAYDASAKEQTIGLLHDYLYGRV